MIYMATIRFSKSTVHDVVARFFVYDVLALNNYDLKYSIIAWL